MSAADLLARLRAHGIALRADGGSLRYRPLDALTPALLAELREHKWCILASLAADDPAVVSRVAAMRRRHPPAPGCPLPTLTARDVPRGSDGCRSCGEPVAPHPDGLAVRCLPCAHAAYLLTNEKERP